MTSLWLIASQTPWWVYVLLAYLIRMGLLATQTRIISFKKLLILPLLLSYFSVQTLMTSYVINNTTISTALIALLLGLVLGYWQVFRLQLKTDKNHFLLQVPGTWSTLVIILMIFCTKFYFHYQLAARPDVINQLLFMLSFLAISIFCCGFFIGKVLCYFYRLQTGAVSVLKKTCEDKKS